MPDIDLDATWWCVDIAGGWTHISRQLKHWVDGQPVLWRVETKQIAPDVYHAYQFGDLYYVCADTRGKVLDKIDDVLRADTA